MPRGGNNRKPTALKVLHGTARPSRLKNEPKPRPLTPEPPPWLDDIGLAVWRKYVPILERTGVLTEADGELLAAFANAMSRYVRAIERRRRIEQEHPEDLALQRKAEVAEEKAEAAVKALGVEFGLSPVARSRIDLPEVKPGEDSLLAKLWGNEG